MKLRIEKEFRDKYTGKKYKAGSEVNFKDERAEELLSDPRSLVTQVAEVPKKPVKKTKK